MLKMRLDLLGDFEVLADRQPISTPSARHPLLEVKADCQRRGRVSVPKIRFCNNGDEARRGRAQI